MTLAEVSGLVFVAALVVWILWPGKVVGRSWWTLPWTTNETRNTIGSVAMWAWFIWMAASFKGTFWTVLAVLAGINAMIMALAWPVGRDTRR